MSELSVTKVTDRAGTGSPNFSQGLKISGTDSGLLAPTRTEGNTEPSTPANGDTWYDTDNDTYDVYINDEWKRLIGAGGGSSWTVDLSNVSYDSVSFSVTSQETFPYGMLFNTDGTKMYMVGSSNKKIHQYSLSTGFDVSTASYDSVFFSVSSQDGYPYDIAFNTDGTKMYMIGAGADKVHQYSLSTGFDLSTASYDTVSFSVTSQDLAPAGIVFNTDGTKMYILGTVNGSVFQYTLSTGFDVSTASYDTVSFSVSSQDTGPTDIAFNTDGTKMYMVGYVGDKAYQYTLSTGFDISTASYDSVSFSVASQETTPTSIVFNNDGTKMYTVGYDNDSVFQYSTGL